MMYRKHSHENSTRFYSQCSNIVKKTCYATLGKPNKTFVAFPYNKLTLLIKQFKLCLNNYAKSLILIIQCKFKISNFQLNTKFNNIESTFYSI